LSNQDPARLIAERIARRFAGDATPSQAGSVPANGGGQTSERPRARVIDFISPAPPARTQSSIGAPAERQAEKFESRSTFLPQVAQSPWLAPFSRATTQANALSADHPSQERFGVEEAVVSELVEFFENEKQCSVDPSGKPCDHCAMCSSRGF
jgi:hypothetical protein